MKKLSADSPHTKLIAAASAFTWMIAIATSAGAAQLQEARVTQVVNDVKLLLKQGAPRPAVVSDLVRKGAAVRTGTQSRSELTFADLTITRLGANTIFSFKEGTREMNLIDGAILFRVPKGSGGATIRTVGVTAAITGTTGIAEFHPATTSHPQPFSKWLCLEGTFHLYMPNGQSVELGPGKMVTADGKSFSQVLTFDIAKLVSTSLFFTGFDQSLASMSLIMLAAQNQLTSGLLATNPLDPTRIVNVISQAIVAEETNQTPPPPPPSKFGTPSVISSPVPYLITNGTVITTDPSITTNGVTDFGKIYRGPVDDGAFSLWAFGSTSAVDTTLDFDTHFNNAGHFPLAAFKFTSLELAGNPTIDLTNGVTNLALISVGDITSGLPGGTLTFSGLDALLLASQDGSINLGSEITFQDIPTLFFYARGTNGDLTLASPIIGTTDLFLHAGRNITFNGGTDLILGGQFSTRSAGGNISVSESGNIAIGGSLAAMSDVIADAANGGNITFATGGSFSASDVVVETSVEPGVTLTNGANISFDIGTGLTVNGGSLSLTINDSNGGTIGTGGNISVTTTGGDLTAGSIDALIDNSNGGTIDSSANLTFNIGGAFTTTGDVSFGISNSNDGSGGGTIGSDAVINMTANNASIGGALSANIINFGGGAISGNATINVTAANITANSLLAQIDNSNGGMIGGAANVAINIDNDVTSPGGVTLQILNGNAGHIVTGANVLYSVGGTTSTTDLTEYIDNSNGGAIDNGGNMTLHTVGPVMLDGPLFLDIDNFNGGTITNGADVTAHFVDDVTDTVGQFHSFNFFVVNGGSDFFGDLGGGTIGTGGNIDATFDGDAATTPTATTGGFAAEIANDHGSIGTGGNISLTIGGNVICSGLFVYTSNRYGGQIGTGGNITFDVAGDVSSAAQAFFGVLNNGGSIDSGTNVAVNVGGDVTTQSSAEFDILNNNNSGSGGGTIGGNATLDVNVGNLTSAPNVDSDALVVQIDNRGGSIGSAAIINFAASGNVDTQGNAIFKMLNFDNGVTGRGAIGGDATMNVSAAGDVRTQGAMFKILNSDFDVQGITGHGAIGGNATISLNAANISTGGPFDAEIDNFNGGSITGSANLTLTLAGGITAQRRGTMESATTFVIRNPGATIGGVHFIGGEIGGDAVVNITAGGDINALGNAFFEIGNADSGAGGGTIGGDARVNVIAGNISIRPPSIPGPTRPASVRLFARIFNSGGNIGGNALISFGVSGDVNIAGNPQLAAPDAIFQIGNIAGTIGGNTAINVTAANIVANSLLAQIANQFGSIGGNAAINMNVSGSATVTNDARVEIVGNDPAGSAAININGSYDVGGTFLSEIGVPNSSIGGNGTLTFNTPSAHADVLKAGVFGTNGVLNVGGGGLSADTTLKLYAPGSNGQLNFVSNVTLGGNSAKILAANSVTIFNNIVVTIGGPNPADVFTNNANYTGFGGNGTTTGTFAGAGANNPQPLINRPLFNDPPSPATVRTVGNPHHGTIISPRPPSHATTGENISDVRRASNAIHVSSSDELLSLLDDAAPGPGGKITIPASKSTSNSRNSSRIDTAGRLNAGGRLNVDRRAMDMRTASSSVMRRSAQ